MGECLGCSQHSREGGRWPRGKEKRGAESKRPAAGIITPQGPHEEEQVTITEPHAPRGPDRRRARRFVFRDRRSGFERRAQQRGSVIPGLDAALIRLRDDPRALIEVLLLANLLSLLDLMLTVILFRQGASEANPFMGYLFANGVAQAAVVKLGIIAAASLGIWQLRRRRPALTTAIFFLVAYGAVVLYEIFGLARLL